MSYAMKDYEVKLKARSEKSIPVSAASKIEAEDLVLDEFFQSESIQFTNDDVVEVEASAE